MPYSLAQEFILKFMITAFFFLMSAAQAKTFVYCSEGSPSAFNPQITTDGTSHNAAGLTIYNRLVEFKLGTTEIVPALAESWKISKDKKTYTFKLRKGVKFHTTKYFSPTREFNADDVLFSINRQLLKDHPYHMVGGGSYEYFTGMEMDKIIKAVAKVDDYSVKITLTEADAPFLANMAMSFMSVLSKEYADMLAKENRKDEIDQYPIGTGPFVFQKYQKDTLIRYERNENYFEGAPKIEKLVFSITPDASVRYQKLKTGECHLIIEPSPNDIEAMKASETISVMEAPGFNVGYLAMNVTKKPFQNIWVRKAINHALNKDAYIQAIYQGHAVKAVNPMPPTIWGYNKKIKGYDYNPELAKKYLKKAGLAKGFETEMWTLPVTRPYNPNGKKMGEMMQADLAAVGIKVKLVTFDWPTYLSKSKVGDHSMIQMGWTGDNGDPDNFLNVLLGCSGVQSGSNYSRWCNKEFNRNIKIAKSNPDIKKRTAYYLNAQEIFNKEVPWVPIAHSIVFRAMNSNVSGYVMDPLGGDIFKTVDIK
ncbi:MAG: ABC transporter substrate-binding protein [Bdellovibrio sp. CG12_big_fil_rev_8_21_14_0_65_39_13]|nr:MAG: ABC transporter substrate-binding protein [Bdellovibrio sp. CG22_combo_CG10-13_8_21_14_all_39_27]PIQ59438.1 MAG: ABC transporter substrate-binding protein [Bdellovibrio sp. CG12_big_fil_rev_8_21_14_0_65_39_13]PIR34906.1 MAG: ABC transporter substrate-binding protein [Bdellovibrio sp. CG11_big_fil_rev_8_21_14_0_20_39_38]PJB53553.1 MAG: ABC transporter substrate-binding protein [Bdellovibrio sp. CG_4_9_14_3_um_filter_39_7]